MCATRSHVTRHNFMIGVHARTQAFDCHEFCPILCIAHTEIAVLVPTARPHASIDAERHHPFRGAADSRERHRCDQWCHFRLLTRSSGFAVSNLAEVVASP